MDEYKELQLYPLSTDMVTQSEFDDISSDFLTKTALKETISCFVPISGNALISGQLSTNSNFTMIGSDFTNISGNFNQSNSNHTINYGKVNGFIQAESAPSEVTSDFGNAYTGTKSYIVLSVDTSNSVYRLKLSGTISAIEALTGTNTSGNLKQAYENLSSDPYHANAYFPNNSRSLKVAFFTNIVTTEASFKNKQITAFNQIKWSGALNTQGSAVGFRITAVDSSGTENGIEYVKDDNGNLVERNVTREYGWVIVDTLPSPLTWIEHQPLSAYYDALYNDDNFIFAPGFPEIGNSISEKLNAQHAEGGSTRALHKYAHAEGRDNTADGKYSHGEGCNNYAGGRASHVEGQYNFANGEFAHVEGWINKAFGRDSHAEGTRTTANGDDSHAAGFRAVASNHTSWVWNGDVNIQQDYNPNKGVGTFCVNPMDGTNGFYIGNDSLSTIINNAIASYFNSNAVNGFRISGDDNHEYRLKVDSSNGFYLEQIS